MGKSIKSLLLLNPWLAIPLVAGLCLLIPLALDVRRAVAEPWQELPAPPSRPVELLGTSIGFGQQVEIMEEDGQVYLQGDVYIRAEDGGVYAYSGVIQAWNAALAKHVTSREPCDARGPWLAEKEGACFQTHRYDGDAPPINYRFLLDADGRLWFWQETPGFSPSYSLCATTGLLAGGLTAIGLAIYARRRLTL